MNDPGDRETGGFIPFPSRLETANLVIRPYETADASQLLRAMMAERDRLSEILPPPVLALRTIAAATEVIRRLRQDWAAGRQFIIPLWDRATGALVGECYLGALDEHVDAAEIGIFTLRRYEARGLAREALLACREAARRTMRLHVLHYRCDADNRRSRALALRCGFIQAEIGTRTRLDGRVVEMIWYRLALADPLAAPLADPGGRAAIV